MKCVCAGVRIFVDILQFVLFPREITKFLISIFLLKLRGKLIDGAKRVCVCVYKFHANVSNITFGKMLC